MAIKRVPAWHVYYSRSVHAKRFENESLRCRQCGGQRLDRSATFCPELLCLVYIHQYVQELRRSNLPDIRTVTSTYSMHQTHWSLASKTVMLTSIPRAFFNLTFLLAFAVCVSATVYVPVSPPVCNDSRYTHEFTQLTNVGSLQHLFRPHNAEQVTFNVATPLKEYVIAWSFIYFDECRLMWDVFSQTVLLWDNFWDFSA